MLDPEPVVSQLRAMRSPRSAEPLRPGVLDFLANYRDLQELGKLTPAELYLRIQEAWRKELLDILATHPSQEAFIALWGRVVPEDEELRHSAHRRRVNGERSVTKLNRSTCANFVGVSGRPPGQSPLSVFDGCV